MADLEETDTLKLISQVTQLNDLHEFMQDKDLDLALEKIIKISTRPDIPANTATRLIVQLQAISAKFSLMAATYATIKRDKAGTPNNYKKNIYYNARDAIDRLVDALKYSARNG